MSSAADENAKTLGQGTAGDRDTHIRHTEEAAESVEGQAVEQRVHAARMSDIRYVIGGLFLLYGVMLLVASAFTSSASLRKAQGVNINLWTGLGMFVLGALFTAWAVKRPVSAEEVAEATEATEGEAYPAAGAGDGAGAGSRHG